ncbi:hypothetical protein BDV41DRAFT_311008 [Aspergillus transmontanensis]|uniref:Uncharacterized protein n=1 Tax=Aspergillus transmontanensis TaxID=1034304 RepID=A0A5N6VUZ1_9EURO|nr:hypothetical protein BDV41DRAFT_311008 [Aspergillus transmontanensis]
MNRSIGFPAHPSEILLDVLHVHFYTISTTLYWLALILIGLTKLWFRSPQWEKFPTL